MFGGVELTLLRLERATRHYSSERSARPARASQPGGALMSSGARKPRERRLPVSFPNAMLQEIYEQPQAIRETIRQNVATTYIILGNALQPIEKALFAFKKIIIAASGSSRHAGLAGEIMMEDLAGVAVDVEYASEYCYRSTHAGADPIVVVITQSGETADTIAAQREALNRGAKTIAISNVADSTIAREASATLHTCAGLEKAIPATKSFTSQLTMLYLLSLFLARQARPHDFRSDAHAPESL